MSDDNYMKEYSDIEPITFSNEKNEKKSTVQDRLKSKVVWVSVISMVLLILGRLGVYEKVGVTQDSVKIIADGILYILVLFGVLNDPKNAEGF